MFRSPYGILFVFVSLSLYTCEPTTYVQPKRLACIFDRTAHGTAPGHMLDAVMGSADACALTCAKCITEKLPILVNIHVLRNLWQIAEKHPVTSKDAMRQDILLRAIPEWMRKNALPGSEIYQAVHCTLQDISQDSSALKDLQQYANIKETIRQDYCIFFTRNINLQLALLLPKKQNLSPEELLCNQDFEPAAFEYINQTVLNGDAGLLELQCFSPEEAAAINKPLDISALGNLFSVGEKDPRHILLFGHGSNDTIAQIARNNLEDFLSLLGAIHCSDLSIFSCFAGSSENRQACYSNVFPVIIFSVGDMVSCTNFSFAKNDTCSACSFATYWNGLDKYLQYKDPLAPEAIECLCPATEAVHAHDPHNFPWFFFPGYSKPIHLSELMEPDTLQDSTSAQTVQRAICFGTEQEPPITTPIASPVKTPLTPIVINDETGIITPEIEQQAQDLRLSIVIEDRKALLLHVDQVETPVQIRTTVPMIISMTNKQVHGFEYIDMGNLYLNSLLFELLATKKTMLVNHLRCVNYQSSQIARSTSGEPLVLEQLLVKPLITTQALLFGQAYFKTTNGTWHKIDISCSDMDKNTVHLDFSQKRIENEHRSLLQNLSTTNAGNPIVTWINKMLPSFQQDTTTSEGQKRRADAEAEGVPDLKQRRR